MSIFKSSLDETGGSLTRQQLLDSFEGMKRRSDWLMANPHGTKNNPHIVHPRTMERGYGICVECGQPVGDWPQEQED
jgi:hypothetical protein